MPKYRVTCHEVWYATYFVVADSKEDAIDEIEAGCGEFLDKDYLETVSESYELEEA